MAAMFIRVDIDDSIQDDPVICKELVEICPVDIFELDDIGRISTVENNLDECTLCDLCIEATESGKVEVVKLYRQ